MKLPYAFDQWCLRCILRISWRANISNEKVRRHTDQPPLTHTIGTTCLKFCSHIASANPSMDQSRAIRTCVAPLTRDRSCRSGRPRHSWLQTTESDSALFNIGLSTAYHREQNRQSWSMLPGMARSSSGQTTTIMMTHGWLVGWLGFNGTFNTE